MIRLAGHLLVVALVAGFATAETKNDKHIIIIGAGASGMAAGTRLMANGFSNVTVLEAESRIGGRVKTIEFGEGLIEMGAQWCHGEKNNAVFQLASQHGLLEPGLVYNERTVFIESDGTIVDRQQTTKLMKLMDLLEFTDEEAAANLGRSVGEFVSEKYAAAMKTDEYKNIDSELAAEFLQFMHRSTGVMDASDNWFDLSMKSYAEYEDLDGLQTWAWGGHGYRTIFDLLMRKIPDPSQTIPIEPRIHFGKTVRHIDWSDASKTRVECTDNSTYTADHVIFTASLGVLRQHHTALFTPALPEAKVNAIDTHKLGTVTKMYLEFAQPFWDADWNGFTTLWRRQEIEQLRANGTDAWLLSVSGVYAVDYQPNLLCGWITGENARHMTGLPEEQAKQTLMRMIRMFVRDRTVPDPIAFKRSEWNKEPNFLGSYSYQTLRSDELHTSRADLAAPLVQWAADGGANRTAVQFAGEATSTDHHSSVHGAIETGWREADRLIEMYK